MKKKKFEGIRPRKHGKYESPAETRAAIERIHGHFERTKDRIAQEKERAASPEGILRTTLTALLKARKTMAAARLELNEAIVTLRRKLPRQ